MNQIFRHRDNAVIVLTNSVRYISQIAVYLLNLSREITSTHNTAILAYRLLASNMVSRHTNWE